MQRPFFYILTLSIAFTFARVARAQETVEYQGFREMDIEIHAAKDLPSLRNLKGRHWTITYTGDIPANFRVVWTILPENAFTMQTLPGQPQKINFKLENPDSLLLTSGDIATIQIRTAIDYNAEQEGDRGSGTGENIILVHFRTVTQVINFGAKDQVGALLFKRAPCNGRKQNLHWEPVEALTLFETELPNDEWYTFTRNTEYVSRDIHLTLCYLGSDDKYREAHTTIRGLKPEQVIQKVPTPVEKPRYVNVAVGYPTVVSLSFYTLFQAESIGGMGPCLAWHQKSDKEYAAIAGWTVMGPRIEKNGHEWDTLLITPSVFAGRRFSGAGGRISTAGHVHLFPNPHLRAYAEVSYEIFKNLLGGGYPDYEDVNGVYEYVGSTREDTRHHAVVNVGLRWFYEK